MVTQSNYCENSSNLTVKFKFKLLNKRYNKLVIIEIDINTLLLH